MVYFYAPGRAGENAESFLTGFDGILQIDGYTGYDRLTKPSRRGGAPLEQAVHDRRPAKGMVLIHHSDRGSQYLSIR